MNFDLPQRLGHSEAELDTAAECLRDGGLVAFPTETVYGLGARADDESAVQKIFLAKGRPSHNPLIAHIGRVEQLAMLGGPVTAQAQRLIDAFWPGPLTLVFKLGTGRVAPSVVAGGSTVGVRMPSHPIALALLRRVDFPVAAPSANRSNQVSPTDAAHVIKSLAGRGVDIVVDAGPTGYGIESTIVDCAVTPMRVLRLGAIPVPSLLSVAPEIIGIERGAAPVVTDPKTPIRSPGQLSRHYAPRAAAILASTEELTAAAVGTNRCAAIVYSKNLAAKLSGFSHRLEHLPAEPAAYAQRLYAALHRLDDLDVDQILIERVPLEQTWDAVRDRLQRATHLPTSDRDTHGVTTP